jgi:hypothetical protein
VAAADAEGVGPHIPADAVPISLASPKRGVLIMLPEVFIVESLREEDHKKGRLEGELIAQLLRLGGRNPIYHLVETYDELVAAIEEFGGSQYRYLHLSCHGSANGFEFFFGSMAFAQFVDLLHDKMENRRIFVSACEAVNDQLANLLIPRSKCYSIIGPFEPIRFDDAAIIWASYYYLAFKNDQTIMDRKLIVRTLSSLTKLYQININYYSISKLKGVKLKPFIGNRIVTRH